VEKVSQFVPGDRELEGLKTTWTETAKPIKILSYNSPKETLNKGEFVRILIGAGRPGDGEAEKGGCESRMAGFSRVD
jgi:hypothetical protein